MATTLEEIASTMECIVSAFSSTRDAEIALWIFECTENISPRYKADKLASVVRRVIARWTQAALTGKKPKVAKKYRLRIQERTNLGLSVNGSTQELAAYFLSFAVKCLLFYSGATKRLDKRFPRVLNGKDYGLENTRLAMFAAANVLAGVYGPEESVLETMHGPTVPLSPGVEYSQVDPLPEAV
jgi:hypothetical protein